MKIIFRKIDNWLVKKLLLLRRHLDYRQNLLLNQHIAEITQGDKDKIHFENPFFLIGEENIQFLGKFYALPGTRIECFNNYSGIQLHPKLIIGNGVIMNYYCHIGVINEVIIGDNVLFGSHVLVTDHQHGIFNEKQKNLPWTERPLSSKGPVHIEDNVWLGDNVCVMPGVTIGKGSVIGANSVVTHNIPSYSMAVGIPAKVIKRVNDNLT